MKIILIAATTGLFWPAGLVWALGLGTQTEAVAGLFGVAASVGFLRRRQAAREEDPSVANEEALDRAEALLVLGSPIVWAMLALFLLFILLVLVPMLVLTTSEGDPDEA
jgi:hypothetical protein